jgi:hypothetical protein
MGDPVEAVINTKDGDQLTARHPWSGHIDHDQ